LSVAAEMLPFIVPLCRLPLHTQQTPDPAIASGVITGLARPVLSYPTLVFCSGASRAGIGRPGALCVGAAGSSAAVCCVREGGGGGVFREVNYSHTHTIDTRGLLL